MLVPLLPELGLPMRNAWLCFWFAFAVAEVAFTLRFHSLTFLAIGAIIPAMILWNLSRDWSKARPVVELSMETVETTNAAA